MSSKFDEVRSTVAKSAVPIANTALSAVKPRIVPTSLLGLALLCFFLPFAEMKCQGSAVYQFSGRELAMGTEIQRPSTRRFEEFSSVGGFQLSAFLALVALAAAFVNRNGATKVSLGATAVSTVTLVLGSFQLNTLVLNKSEGGVTVSMQFGFYITLILLALSTIKFWEVATGKSFRSLLPNTPNVNISVSLNKPGTPTSTGGQSATTIPPPPGPTQPETTPSQHSAPSEGVQPKGTSQSDVPPAAG